MNPDHPRPDDADREAPELSGAGCWVALAALVMNAEYVWHGYTCDLCDWGRDRAPAVDEYARHLRSEHCVSDAERAGAGRLREAARRAALSDHAPMFAEGSVYRACGCHVHAALRAALDAEPGQPR